MNEHIYYKFSSPITALKILTSKQLRYTPLNELNDPLEREFEIVPNLSDEEYDQLWDKYSDMPTNGLLTKWLCEGDKPKWLRDNVRRKISEIYGNSGIISLTKNNFRDLSMFSSYGGYQKGVCFGFDFSDKTSELSQLDYQEKVPEIEIDVNMADAILKKIIGAYNKEEAKSIDEVFRNISKVLRIASKQKLETWESENEHRMIMANTLLAPDFFNIENNLISIDFGVYTEDYLIEAARILLKSFENTSDPKLYKLSIENGILSRRLV